METTWPDIILCFQIGKNTQSEIKDDKIPVNVFLDLLVELQNSANHPKNIK
jgi:hypothetical protein